MNALRRRSRRGDAEALERADDLALDASHRPTGDWL